MEYFKKCPKCGRYMTPHLRYVYGQALTIYSCFCGYSEDTFGVRYDNKQVIREVERVAEWLSDNYPCKSCQKSCSLDYWCEELENYVCDCVKKLAKYETAEKDGRLVVLPCKVGDTVYVIVDTHVEVFEVNKIELKHTVFGNFTYFLEKPAKRGMLFRYYNRDIENTVFLTREEAEKALEEMKKNE